MVIHFMVTYNTSMMAKSMSQIKLQGQYFWERIE